MPNAERVIPSIRWQKVKDVFHGALERAPADRGAYLDAACGTDLDLRSEVESLLGAYEGCPAFIEVPALAGGLRLDAEAEAIEPLDGLLLGPYRLRDAIGEGGMGSVYRAVRADDRYEKEVAVKLVRQGLESAQALDRFQNECRILARLEHPGIARILDAGTAPDGRPYVVMEYVEGRRIDSYVAEEALDTRARLGLFRSVCAAVHYAHQNLVVHRDIKPSNILVTSAGAPKLLDFGIAKLLDADTPAEVTATQARVMTPEYASPEQVRGEPVTTATDVYILGILLYELLTGRRPHAGDRRAPHELARMICDEEPDRPSLAVSPRATPETVGGSTPTRKPRRDLAGDVDTIVLKALQKDPARRYSSVEALSEDIRRHLEGLPVLARPDSLRYRARMFVRRHRLGVVVAVSFAAALAGLAGQARRAEQVRAQGAVAQRFAQEAEVMEAMLRQAHLLPLHDTQAERVLVRARMRAIEAEMDGLGPIAGASARYALGRGHLALGEAARARAQLEAAWSQGNHTPAVSYALGRALGALYRDALHVIREGYRSSVHAARRREAETTLRDPALVHLRAGQPSLGEPRAFVSGLIALYEQRYDDAIGSARQALAEAPWLYEAKILEGDGHLAIGIAHEEASRYGEAEKAYDEAGARYRAAAAAARSDAVVYERDCLRFVLTVRARQVRGLDVREALGQGAHACADALAADSRHGDAYMRLSNLYRMEADLERSRGGDALPGFERAIEMGHEGVRWSPESPSTWRSLGLALWRKAEYEIASGRDPRVNFDRATLNLRQARRRAPDHSPTLINLGTILMTRARHDMSRGLDPRERLGEARQCFDDAVEIVPDNAAVRLTLGVVHLTRAELEAAGGNDPRPSLRRAVQSYDEAIRINPNDTGNHYNRAGAWAQLAQQEMARGVDPAASLEQAVRSASDALALNARFGGAHLVLGDVHLVRARHAFRNAEDPRMHLREAERAFHCSLEIDRGYTYGWTTLAQVHEVEAEYLLSRGQSPMPAVEKGLAVLRRARESDSSAGRASRARLELQSARWRRAGARAARHVEAAETHLRKAAEENPRDADVWLALAEVGRWSSESAGRDGSSARAEAAVAAGLTAVDKGLGVNPSHARLHATRGALLAMRARIAGNEAARAEAVAQSQAAYAKALAVDPRLEWPYRP